MAVTFNGKPFKAGDFEKSIRRQMKEIVAKEMRERVGAIRHPKTGEFPVVAVRGNALDDLRLSVEGSPELIAVIRERLPLEEAGMIDFAERESSTAPMAFLSYASEDRALAERVVTSLQAAGIETWWDQWEIGAGDSIVQKVNAGLGGCTHFIVLLTSTSIQKPWVQTEMDAGFVRKVSGEVKFVALRSGLPATSLPALLRPLHSPEISADHDKSIAQLVADIHQVTKKPALGKKPAIAEQPASPYSAAAMAVAGYFCRETKHAVWGDPNIDEVTLSGALGMSLDDLQDALYELRHFFKEDHFGVTPDSNLWAEFDKYFIDGVEPEKDAFQIATDMMNNPAFPSKLSEIADQYGWTARRLNPAVAFLLERKLVEDAHYLGSGAWVTSEIYKSDATRRFVKSRT